MHFNNDVKIVWKLENSRQVYVQDLAGKEIVIFNPCPGSLSADTCPLCAWTMDLAIANPNPEPPASR